MTSWPAVPIGEVAEIVSGTTPRTGEPSYWGGDVLWATPTDLSKLSGSAIGSTERTLTSSGLASCASTVLPAGSVLLSSRAPIGLVAINTAPMATNQGFKSLVPRPDRLDARYAYHWLLANRGLLQSLGNGATFKELSKTTLSRVTIPLPPMDEQRRIAAVLDRADAVGAASRGVDLRVDALVSALFESWFPPSSFEVAALSGVADEFRYGTSTRSGPTGLPVLRIPNVVGGAIDTAEIKTVELPDAERSRLRLRDGDLLIVRSNGNPAYVGRTAVFSADALRGTSYEDRDVVYASYLIRVRLDQSRVEPRFVHAFLLSSVGRRAIRTVAKTSAGQYNVNVEGLGALPVPIPPVARQREFVTALNTVNRLRQAYRTRAAKLDVLTAALRDRAFKGEL